MTLRLVIEHSPNPQPQSERRFEGGEFSIGRGAECDWQLVDPDQFVSRRHCVISGAADRFVVTDASRGGLFIDGGDRALGPGNSAPLEHGMRIRLGDVVIRVEIMRAEAAPEPVAARGPATFDSDDFFSPRPVAAPPPRPETLPDPFERPSPPAADTSPRRTAAPVQFDDPFTLDPSPPRSAPASAPSSAGGFGGFFDAPQPSSQDEARADTARMRERPPAEPAAPQVVSTTQPAPFFADFEEPPPPPTPPVSPAPAAPDRVSPTAPTPVASAAPPSATAADIAAAPPDVALWDAFFKGMGLSPSTPASAAEMEAFGRRFRLMTEGLLHLLRTRSKEKMNVRVAQTVIGNTDVNPLKFVVTGEEALASLIAHRGQGYLGPEDAINGAFRDLTDHQRRTWAGVQAALRAMIDRFDPAQFEVEVEAVGLLRSLIAGGRSAQLWQLYTDRYQDIARSAEDRFLGEVGGDFRNSYEGTRKTEDGQ